MTPAEAVAASLGGRPSSSGPPPPPADLAAWELEATRRRHAVDPLAFARDCLPEHFSSDVDPSAFHRDALGTFARLRDAELSLREAYEAPRSGAKSTYFATLLPMLACCLPEVYGLRFLVPVRARYKLAEEDVDAVRLLLESEPVRRIYGDLEGRIWNKGLFITRDGVRVQAAGADQGNRGLRDPVTGARPDCVILDDLDKDAESRSVRDKIRRWVKGALLGMKAAGRHMHVLAVGTCLDTQALIRWFKEQPGFRHRSYAALLSWPDELDGLWRRFEELYVADDEVGPSQARGFYQAHRDEMDAGAEVLWDGDPLVSIMEDRITMGPARFAAEKMNDARGGEDALIQAEWIHWYGAQEAPEGGVLVRDVPSSWRTSAAALDPALGKKGGDYTVAVGGHAANDGRIFVRHADCARMPKDEIPSRTADVVDLVGASALRSEEVGAFELLHQPLVDAIEALGLTCAVESWRPPTDKPARLQGLQPLIKAGRIVLHVSLRGLPLDQLLSLRVDGTSKDHDDFPDALEMLTSRLRLATSRAGKARMRPVAGRNGRILGDLGGGRNLGDVVGAGRRGSDL